MNGTSPAASATERDQIAEVAAVFNRVCDEITALHGAPFLRTDEFVSRLGDCFITAGWFLDGANHGFKIKRDRDVNRKDRAR